MKKVLVSVFGLCLAAVSALAQPSDPTLMKINGKEIPISEFEYIYNKNNSNNVLDKKSLEEYVDLFVNFKLKVEEAIAQGLDTTQSFRSELALYRNQLAEQYLTDSSMSSSLLKNAYDRKKEEVEVSHILVKIADTGTAADTLAAYNKALGIYKRAQREDFGKLADGLMHCALPIRSKTQPIQHLSDLFPVRYGLFWATTSLR
ncbi:MAG: PpiC-type peptidyl-prolyl cis-trans isomerase [Bacteroidetes bacterium]|nr:PpiC-type peptidyl-prolyl cis-trans isomerase [Bacteroidota bacterium]